MENVFVLIQFHLIKLYSNFPKLAHNNMELYSILLLENVCHSQINPIGNLGTLTCNQNCFVILLVFR